MNSFPLFLLRSLPRGAERRAEQERRISARVPRLRGTVSLQRMRQDHHPGRDKGTGVLQR